MTFREAILKIAPYEFKERWIESLEGSKHAHLLERDFNDMRPKEISDLRDQVVGIGNSFVHRLLDLKFNIVRDFSGPK